MAANSSTFETTAVAEIFFVQTSSPKSLEEYNKYVDNMAHLSQLRKKAEEDHLTVVKSSVQGSKLCEMLTGGSGSLDKSHFERYVLVINKSHPVQKESLAFLLDMNLTAVLDFDPESAETGLNKLLMRETQKSICLCNINSQSQLRTLQIS